MSKSHLTVAVILLAMMPATRAHAGNEEFANYPWIPYDHPALQYMERALNDPVGRLSKKLDNGEVKLKALVKA